MKPRWNWFQTVMAGLSFAAVFVVFARWFARSFLLSYEPYKQWSGTLLKTVGTNRLVLIAGAVLFAGFVIALRWRRGGAASDEAAHFGDKRKGMWLFRTIRWKLLFSFFCSVAVTIALLWCIRAAGSTWLKANEGLSGMLRPQLEKVGTLPILAGIGSVIFLVLFFLMSDQIIRYLREITSGLQQIAGGKLEHRIAVRSSDELGEVAYNINQMSRTISESLEEERLAEKTKNDLITGVSHDLRTPLTSILGFLELIVNGRYKDEDELRGYAGIAYDKSLSLKRLIDDLFEFTRLNGGMPLQLAELDLNDFCNQLMEEFVPSLEAAGMEGRVCPSPQPLRIMADGNRLVRAYENLITNAIRYGKAGRIVLIRLREDNGEAVAEVVNYGEPIPEQDMPFLFERFYRGDPSRSKETGGTGLGLPIVRTIAELHSGTVTVRSSREETVFETRFPLHSSVREIQEESRDGYDHN